MITVGDKIKLKKAMGCFDNIGEICEIISISDDLVIGFKFGNGRHMGCMSYNEMEKYFTKVEKNTSYDWTKWTTYGAGRQYKTNGMRVLVKDVDGNKGSSKCHPEDKFDLKTGVGIADARMKLKMIKKDIEKANAMVRQAKECECKILKTLKELTK